MTQKRSLRNRGKKAVEGRGRDCGDPVAGMPTATRSWKKEQTVSESPAATMISDIWPPELSKSKFLLF